MLTLSRADAFGSLDLNRRETLWDVAGLEADELPLLQHATQQASAGIAQHAEASVCDDPGYRQSRFRDDASIGRSLFRDGASFGQSLFEDDASFGRSRFRDDASFGRSLFEDDASFGRGRLRGDEGVTLPPLRAEEAVAEDYSVFGLSLRNHPMAFFRPELKAKGMATAADLKTLKSGKFVKIAGLVLFRQRPGTAKGTIFVTIEDETGAANLIVWPKVAEAHRRAVFGAKAIYCEGILQKESNVIHLVSRRLDDWTAMLRRLKPEASAFKLRFGRGDEAAHASTSREGRPSKTKLGWTDTLKSRDFR